MRKSYTHRFFEDLKEIENKYKDLLKGQKPTVDVVWVESKLEDLQKIIREVGKSIGES